MNKVTLYNPRKLVFGPGSLSQMAEDYISTELNHLFIITIPALLEKLNPIIDFLKTKKISVKTAEFNNGEPTFADYEMIRKQASDFKADSVAGIGGGSIMDLSKVIAALLYSDTKIKSVIGADLIKEKGSYLICMPTTSGTGSEVSPNSILIDENDSSKKGIISQHLVPDASYIDPTLTIGVPQNITAFTGIDALTHCIEAYTNKNAHPVIDNFAINGIRLICGNLKKAYKNGGDIEARTNVALGSVYGGLCLGPVNTAAVHALAYPLGSEFKMPHGLSNAVLLPYVMEYNLPFSEEKYANIAVTAGADQGQNNKETAINGISIIKNLIRECNIKDHLSDYNIPENKIDKMAEMAIQIQRLLKNNIRGLSLEDIKTIYKSAYN